MTVYDSGKPVFLQQNISPPERTEAKLQSFRQLPPGWNYGEGVPSNQVAFDNALCLLCEATRSGFYDTDAFPGTDGEIMLTIYFSEHYLEFILELDGSVTFCYERADQEISYVEGLSLSDAANRIAELWDEIWTRSESLTDNVITTHENTGSSVSHSGIQAATQEFRSLIVSVSAALEEPFVNISAHTTPQPQVTPLSSGLFRPRACPMTAG
jgi:hypothetical protein